MVFDPLREYPGYAIRRASTISMSALAAKLAEEDLRISEATILLVIRANPRVRQSAICKALDIARANIAPLIGRLDRRNLIHRKPLDGRSHGLVLSTDGEKLAKRVMKIVEEHETAVIEKIPEDLREPFMKALDHLWSPAD